MFKIKFHKILVINILCFILIPKISATDAQQVFQEANQAFTTGNYAVAVEKYEAILKENVFSKELYYNLGNSYYRLNQTGKSILNYERALRIAPSDGDVQQNLALAKSHIVEDIEPISNVFIVRWWHLLKGYLSADSWAMLALFLLWTGISGMSLWLLSSKRTLKKRGFILGAVLVPLSILPFLLANNAKNETNSSKYAIIMVRETPFRTSPDANAAPTAMLHEGIKIEILDKISSLIKTRLPNGEEGWIEETAVEKI